MYSGVRIFVRYRTPVKLDLKNSYAFTPKNSKNIGINIFIKYISTLKFKLYHYIEQCFRLRLKHIPYPVTNFFSVMAVVLEKRILCSNYYIF